MSLPDLSTYPLLIPHVANALRHAEGTHTVEDVQQLLIEGKAILWPAIDSAVVTQIRDTPQKRLLHIFLAGGQMAEIRDLMPIIYAWAASHGCVGATFTGRKGWERTFVTKAQGWDAKWTGFYKDRL